MGLEKEGHGDGELELYGVDCFSAGVEGGEWQQVLGGVGPDVMKYTYLVWCNNQ